MSNQLTCPNCGKQFTPWRGKKFCSERCRKQVAVERWLQHAPFETDEGERAWRGEIYRSHHDHEQPSPQTLEGAAA